MAKKTNLEVKNDARFGNRRKMAFWSLYAILFITMAVTIKILIIPSTSVDTYTPILSWGLSVLGGVILAYIGAASYEQKSNGDVDIAIKEKIENDEEDDDDSYWDRNRRYGGRRNYNDEDNDTPDQIKEFVNGDQTTKN